jgi:hypothetical protein
LLVRERESDRVETALRVDESRLKTRQSHDGETITGLGIIGPAVEGQMVLAEVGGDVVFRVDPREVDPGLVALSTLDWLEVHTELWQIEDVATGARVPADDRQTERADRGHDGDLFRT